MLIDLLKGYVSFEFFLIWMIGLIIAFTIHECAHAWVAYRLGDPTAKYEGRITLNPLKHIDSAGFFMILFVGIGWAKPVPFNPRNFQDPVKGSVLTALAGPASNILLALILSIPIKYLHFYGQDETFLYTVLSLFFDMNLLLAIFNMFPFPPLDGSKVMAIFIPRDWHDWYDNYLETGMSYFMIFLLLDTFFLPRYFGFSIFWSVLDTARDFLKTYIFLLT